MFMINDLTNVCNEIITIRLLLWMAYTRNVKELDNALYIVFDHSSKFKAV